MCAILANLLIRQMGIRFLVGNVSALLLFSTWWQCVDTESSYVLQILWSSGRVKTCNEKVQKQKCGDHKQKWKGWVVSTELKCFVMYKPSTLELDSINLPGLAKVFITLAPFLVLSCYSQKMMHWMVLISTK